MERRSAIVDAQNRVHLRNVTLGQNLGQTVQVTSGLSPGDKLVNNPPAGLLEGQSVQPVTPVAGYAMAAQKTRRHAMKRHATALVTSLAVALLSGCDLAPVYDPPHFILPASYQGSGPFEVAHPEAALSPRGDWWTLFGDAQLNKLEDATGACEPDPAGRRGCLRPGTEPRRRGAVGALSAGERERRNVV